MIKQLVVTAHTTLPRLEMLQLSRPLALQCLWTGRKNKFTLEKDMVSRGEVPEQVDGTSEFVVEAIRFQER